MIVSLKKIESEPNYNQDLIKASKNLNKTSPETDIHLIVEGVLQKTSENMYVNFSFYHNIFFFSTAII